MKNPHPGGVYTVGAPCRMPSGARWGMRLGGLAGASVGIQIRAHDHLVEKHINQNTCVLALVMPCWNLV